MLDVYIYCLVLSLIFNFVLFNQKIKNKKNEKWKKKEKEEDEKKWSWINKVLIWELDLGALVDFVDIRGLLLVLNFHLFPIAPLFLWDLATYSIFFFLTLSLAPLQSLKTFWSSYACVVKSFVNFRILPSDRGRTWIK